jgi:hypothetical protein
MSMTPEARKAQLYTWLFSDLAGSTRDASDVKITLYQDDATHTKHIEVGKKRYHGDTWGQAIQAAHDDFMMNKEAGE